VGCDNGRTFSTGIGRAKAAAPERETGDAAGSTPACGISGVEDYSDSGTDTSGADPGGDRLAGAISDQATTMDLLRAGGGDTLERGVRIRRRESSTAEDQERDTRIELELQSADERSLQGRGRGWDEAGTISSILRWTDRQRDE